MPSTGSPYVVSRFTDGQTGYCGYYFRAVIDSELRLLARAWRVARQMTGRTPSTVLIDQLLYERAASSTADAHTDSAPVAVWASDQLSDTGHVFRLGAATGDGR